MDPGRNMDFQTSVSRTRSRTSLGDGGLSFNLPFPSPSSWLLFLGRVLYDLRRQHEDAVPWAHVLAGPAQDAVVRIQHQVLRGPHALGEPRGVDGLDDVVGVDVDLGLLE